MSPIVSLKNVNKVFNAAGASETVALRDVNLDIQPREFISLIGPSGCGKSTLLRCIAGLDRASEGEVLLRGVPVTEPPEGLGMVFQRDVLVDWRSIRDNVLLAAEFQGLARRDHVARADALLVSCGGLRTLDITVPLESATGLPVVSSMPIIMLRHWTPCPEAPFTMLSIAEKRRSRLACSSISKPMSQ